MPSCDSEIGVINSQQLGQVVGPPHPPSLHSRSRRRRRPRASGSTGEGVGVNGRMITNSKGYEYLEDSDGNPSVPHHRLLAVAEHGVDALDDDLVHHCLPVEWLNFRGNVTMLTPTEHARVHADDGTVDDLAELVDDRDDGRPEVGE